MKKSIVQPTIVFLCIIIGTVMIGIFYSKETPSQTELESTITPTQTSQPTAIPTATQSIAEPTVPPTPRIVYKYSTLNVLSPVNNAVYTTRTIQLTYTIDSKVLWSYYGLDIVVNGAGSSQYTGINELFTLHGLVSFKGNITLNLPEGKHTLLLAVQTQESRGSSVPIAYQTIDFTINTDSD